MPEAHSPHDDEIDLFALFESLWAAKWLIGWFCLVSVLIGGVVVVLTPSRFETYIRLAEDTVPPFYAAGKATSDFEKQFFTSRSFVAWERSLASADLTFDDLNRIFIKHGVMLSKGENEQLAMLQSDKKEGTTLLIRTDELTILRDIFEYAEFINQQLKATYLRRARDEAVIIESRRHALNISNDLILDQLLAIDRFENALENGADVLIIRHPTAPAQKAPKTGLILSLSLVLGGMMGVVFVMIRNAIYARQKGAPALS